MAVCIVNPYRFSAGGGPVEDLCDPSFAEDSAILASGGTTFDCYDDGLVADGALTLAGSGLTSVHSGGEALGVFGMEKFEDYESESTGLFYTDGTPGASVTNYTNIYTTTQVSGEHYEALVTIPAGKVGSDLTDFPFCISLGEMPQGFWDNVESTGSDIRAFADDGTRLPIDIIAFDPLGQRGTIFVKTDIASGSDTEIRIQVGNGGLIAPHASQYGRYAVWSDYDFVLFGESPVTAIEDHTGGTNPVVYGDPGPDTASELPTGTGIKFANDTTEYVECDNIPTRTDFTLACTAQWVNLTATRTALSYRNLGAGNTDFAAIQVISSDTIAFYDTENGLFYSSPTYNHNVGNYWRCVLTQQGSTRRDCYVNGGSTNSDVGITDFAAAVSPDHITIGSEYPLSGDDMVGDVNFVYLRNGVLSADWIAAEYNNLFNDVSDPFYTVIDYVT